jgi:hypothetical protein
LLKWSMLWSIHLSWPSGSWRLSIKLLCNRYSMWFELMGSSSPMDHLGLFFRQVWQCPTNHWTCSVVIPKNRCLILLNVVTYPAWPCWAWAFLIESNASDMGTSQSGASDGYCGWRCTLPFRMSMLCKATVRWLYCAMRSGPYSVSIHTHIVHIDEWFVLPTGALSLWFGNINQFLYSLSYIVLKEVLVVTSLLSK